ncbi:MAG: hypothetical protein QNI84_14660 [Henriciella sp.]|nr:hypothetical protein [Henriciella sp.]
MSRAIAPLSMIARWWTKARPRLRLAVGTVLVGIVGLMGLTPNVFFGTTVSWPYMALIAAIGWGRAGLGFSPMLVLILFGFAQDVTASAPLGSFALVNLATYGLKAGLYQAFDAERSPGVSYGLPILILFMGIIIVWLLASLSSNHVVRFMPLFASFLATMFVQMIVAPVFDLGVRAAAGREAML